MSDEQEKRLNRAQEKRLNVAQEKVLRDSSARDSERTPADLADGKKVDEGGDASSSK